MKGDIFRKELKLYELIERMVVIENKPIDKWDSETIRLINAFPFKYSEALLKKIEENVQMIESYFATKEIERLL